ncbi:18681_t:CDS:1, partial [Gigaspora margarita]
SYGIEIDIYINIIWGGVSLEYVDVLCCLRMIVIEEFLAYPS